MFQLRTVLCAALLVAVSSAQVFAQERYREIAGHELVIEGEIPEQTLLIDGAVVRQGVSLAIDTSDEISGVPIVVVYEGQDMAACSDIPVIIAFGPDGSFQIDGPPDTCRQLVKLSANDAMFFTAEPFAALKGERWTWTADKGLTGPELIDLSPDPLIGWKDLDEVQPSHPGELLGYAEIATAINTLAGPRAGELAEILSDIGSFGKEGGIWQGWGCEKIVCQDRYAFVYLDPKTGFTGLAWQSDPEEGLVQRPDAAEWPEAASAALKQHLAEN